MRIIARLVEVLHVYTHTRVGPAKLRLEQRLNDSGVSTASQVSISPFILTFHPSTQVYLMHPQNRHQSPQRPSPTSSPFSPGLPYTPLAR